MALTRNHLFREHEADPHVTRIGTTFGLAAQTCSRETYSAEQVYVQTDVHPGVAHHPVYIEGWVGYDVKSRLRLTRRQTVELIGLLVNALYSLPPEEQP